MADRYFNPAGAANWADANVWALTDGGTADQATPTSADNVYFTSTNVNNCTIGASATCLDLSFTGGTGYTGTLAGFSALAISGSLTLNSGMGRTYTGAITFNATSSGKTITTNTRTTASAITFNGASGGWTLQDAWDNGSTSSIVLTNGTLNTNGQTLTTGSIQLGSGTKTLTLGASSINLAGAGPINFTNNTNFTFNVNTSTITCSNVAAIFQGNGATFNNVIFSNITGLAQITGANTFNNFTLTGGNSYDPRISYGADQTVTGTFTPTSYSTTARLFHMSSVPGTQRTITTAAVGTLADDLFQDIVAAGGAGTWSGTRLGNGGNNSNITFDGAVTRYWVGGTGGFNDSTHWSTSSGGGSGASVPLVQDTAIFDANSTTGAGQTFTIDGNVNLGPLDISAVDQTPTFNMNSLAQRFFGNVTFGSDLTWSNNATAKIFQPATGTTATLTCNSAPSFSGITMTGAGTLAIADAITMGTLTFTRGTLDINADITCSVFSSSNSNTRTLNLGSGTITVSSSGTIWLVTSTGLTLNKETSTIKLTNTSASSRTFAGGNLEYNNFWSSAGASSASLTISGSNIFNDFKDDGTNAHSIIFTADTTQTVTSFTVNGTAGNLITLDSTTGTNFILSKTSGTVSCNYLSIQDSTAQGGATWYAGANSVDGGGANSGWIFEAIPEQSDSITITEDNTQELNLFISAFDAISISESQEIFSGHIVVDDALSITESITQEVISFISADDSISITEDIVSVFGYGINVSDSISISEDASTLNSIFLSTGEDISIIDSPSIDLVFIVSADDSISIDESSSVTQTMEASSSDSITIAENTAFGLSIFLSSSETITMSEDASVERIIIFTGSALWKPRGFATKTSMTSGGGTKAGNISGNSGGYTGSSRGGAL